ncbi:spore photoproduct lyase family protein [Oribacterium sp.]
MVYIFAAHKGEVEHLIKKLSLGKRKTSFPFLQYEGEEILLTITGQEQINASVSVAATLQEEKAKKGDILLSLGSAAVILGKNRTASEELMGRWFWIQSLEQESTGRCFYPDLLYKLDFPEAGLLTGDKILELSPSGNSGISGDSDSKEDIVSEGYSDSKEDIVSKEFSGFEKLLLYDMESAAVFQAANFYLAPEDFFFLRCVTDFGVSPGEETDSFSSSSLLWKEKMQSLLQKEEEKVLRLIRFLQEKSIERRKEEEEETVFQQQLQSLSESLHCSFVMEKQLERLLRYAFLQGISPEEIREYLEKNFGRRNTGDDAGQDAENGTKEEVLKGLGKDIDKQGGLTLIDKRAGKKALSSLKEWILSERTLQVECDGSGDSLQTNRCSSGDSLQTHCGSSETILMNHCQCSENSLQGESPAKSYPYQEHFQHIYVEEALLQSSDVERILRKFPKAKVIPIRHYKDVFNRKKQGRLAQSHSRKLILAKKEGQRLYDGAVVCQDFSESHFCYTSLLMNCPFHCAYCYLQGMYPSSNLVMFLNLEDYFSDCRKWIAEKGSLYLCISYDTDLLAMEGIYPYVEEFARFLNQENALRIEVRTKAGGEGLWRKMQRLPLSSDARKRMIFAFTLSPEEIVEEAEEGTARLSSRIFAIQKALEEGYLVRLCFDPMVYHPRWKALYSDLLQEVFEKIPMEQIHDCSLGSFRISESYLKAMGKALPNSPHTQFPYENTGGYYHYPKELMEEMEGFLYSRLQEKLPKEKIFRWDSQEEDSVDEK